MDTNEIYRIKQKIMKSDPSKFWGDEFDIRFYLISKLKDINNCRILDVGGGIGILCSEMAQNNLRINLDSSFSDLKTCSGKIDSKIQNVCGSMETLPFKENYFDVVICSHLIEIAKHIDVTKQQFQIINGITQYPTVEKTLGEICRVLKRGRKLFLTTPNNAYYQSTKLEYNELKKSLSNHFDKYILSFFNIYPKLSKNYRKLNLSNVVPKLISKLKDKGKVLESMIVEDSGKNRGSVSFYVEALKG